jgi:hypothetical protein
MEISWIYCTIPIAIGLGFLLLVLYSCFALSGRISQQQEELLGQIESQSKPVIKSVDKDDAETKHRRRND